ncbi:MAG: hypothetical protein JWO31_3954 [Phycisphaerales bacterium]|nr:hypothetical protein [Phycisphaerales bacterium]
MSNAARLFAFVTEPGSAALPPRTASRLVVAVAAGLAVAIGSLAALLVLVGRTDWWRGLLAASVASALASALSLPPLAWGVRRSVNAAVAGYFAAAGIRLAVSLGACLLAVKAGGYPEAPTLLLMAAIYAVVLAAEAVTLAFAAWSAGSGATPAATKKTN